MAKPFSIFHWLETLLGGPATADLRSSARIATYAAMASLAVSLILFANQGLINRDGILYVTVAKELLDGNWQQAYWLFHWLFYPLLIAGVSFLTGLGVETAAHVLNALLAAVMVWSFVAILRELGASRAVQIAGAIVLLLHPYFNDWRPAIIREHGFYAFLMLSALFYLRYQKDLSWRHTALWFGTLVMATLFRIQSVPYFVLIPLFAAFLSPGGWHARAAQLSKPAILIAGSGIVTIIGALMVGGVENSPLIEPVMRVEMAWQALGGGLEQQATLYADKVLNSFTRDYAVAGLIATLLIAVIDKAVGSISALYLVLPALTGLNVFDRGTRREWALVTAYATTGLAIAVGFALSEQYIVSRYVAPFSLFFLLTTPYFLVALITATNRTTSKQRRVLGYIVVIVFVGMSLDSLYESPSANLFVRDGGHWVKQNLPAGSRTYTNSNRLAYYAGLELDWSNRNTGDIPGKQAWREMTTMVPADIEKNFDYAAIAIPRKRFKREKSALLNDARIQLIKEIGGPRGGGTLMFVVNKN